VKFSNIANLLEDQETGDRRQELEAKITLHLVILELAYRIPQSRKDTAGLRGFVRPGSAACVTSTLMVMPAQ